MSSIERAALAWFFNARIVPAARQLEARGLRLLDHGPADDADSWYVEYPESTPDLERADEAGIDALERIWTDDGLPELVALLPGLRRLQRVLRAREADGDVSPFVYVMY